MAGRLENQERVLMFKYFADSSCIGRFSVVLALLVCVFGSKVCFALKPEVGQSGLWDPDKYISVDEITPDMQAYCLTVYEGTNVEKFEMEIISIVKDGGVGNFPF